MAPRPITPTIHGVLDYLTGAQLLAAPRLLGIEGTRAGRILRLAGASHTGYSVATKYPLGAVKVLPYKAHLAIDAAAAVGLAASPWLLGTAGKGTRHWLPHVLFGVWEMGAVALSDPREPVGEVAGVPTQTAAQAAPAEVPPAGPLGPPSKAPASEVVMPDGVEANAKIGARTIGGANRPGGGIGSGTGPGSDPGVGGQQL